MFIAIDIETATPTPQNVCHYCGCTEFSELGPFGSELAEDHVMCVGCQKVLIKYHPDFRANWRDYAPIGVACAAASYINADGGFSRKFWMADEDKLSMTGDQCVAMLQEWDEWQKKSHRIVSWNGLGFDFPVLDVESEASNLCTRIAMNHTDLMFLVFAKKGYRLGLDTALSGAGIESKQHEVTLSTGEVITEMTGAMAPILWQQGEREAVLFYLGVDVDRTIQLAHHINRFRRVGWISKSGRHQSVPLPRGSTLPQVDECLNWKKPYIWYMDNPQPRSYYTEWMNGGLGAL